MAYVNNKIQFVLTKDNRKFINELLSKSINHNE